MSMRASEVESFGILHSLLKVLFLSIFCRYKRYAYGMAIYKRYSIPTKY